MTVYQDVRVPLPEPEWTKCPVCDGTGRMADPQTIHRVRCMNPVCEGGTVKYRLGRTSQTAALAAHNAARRR